MLPCPTWSKKKIEILFQFFWHPWMVYIYFSVKFTFAAQSVSRRGQKTVGVLSAGSWNIFAANPECVLRSDRGAACVHIKAHLVLHVTVFTMFYIFSRHAVHKAWLNTSTVWFPILLIFLSFPVSPFLPTEWSFFTSCKPSQRLGMQSGSQR